MDPASASSPPSEPAESELHKARASSPGYDQPPNWVPEWIPNYTPGSPSEMGGNLDAVPLSSRSRKSLLFPRGRRMLGRAKEHRPLSKDSAYSTASIKSESQSTRRAGQQPQRTLWELPSVIARIRRDQRLEFVLKSITLTMSDGCVVVTTSEEFIREKYAEYGIEFVRHIISALDSDKGTYADVDLKFTTSKTEIAVWLNDSVAHLWNLVLWLSLTFRQPMANTLCLSTCKVGGSCSTLQRLSQVPVDTTNCWFDIFESGLIAVQPDTVLSGRESMFLQADFHLMLQITAVEYPVLVDEGLVLVGYSTALVPVKLIDDKTILWHVEVAKHESQIKIEELSAIKGSWLKFKTLDALKSKKALVGWCGEAITLLGTGQLDTVQWSNSKIKQTTWSLSGANLQFVATSTAPIQLGGQAGLTFDISINTLRFSAARNYLKCLNSSSSEQIVLYDVGESKAWLVPLICVFHEMLLTYWRSIPERFRQPNIPFSKPASDGAEATYAALRDCGSYIVEESQDDRLSIRELILGFSTNLSRITLQRPSRTEIYGYEFMDIMTDSSKSDLKRSKLNKTGLPWIPLLDHFHCLFCSGLGDAIRGSKGPAYDSPCNQLPKGNDWLAASIHSIEKLNKRHGGGLLAGERKLSSCHFWRMTGFPFGECEHGDGSKSSCWEDNVHLLQEISAPGSERPSTLKLQNYDYIRTGAVVFGRPRRPPSFMKRLPMHIARQKGEQPASKPRSCDPGAISLEEPTRNQHNLAVVAPSGR